MEDLSQEQREGGPRAGPSGGRRILLAAHATREQLGEISFSFQTPVPSIRNLWLFQPLRVWGCQIFPLLFSFEKRFLGYVLRGLLYLNICLWHE